MFSGVPVLTVTAISVDRLLALMLGLSYRQEVTSKREWDFAVISWLISTAAAVLRFYNYRYAVGIICMTMLVCIVTSIFCYTKIFLRLCHHQAQVHDQVHQIQNMARYRKTVSSAL